MTWSAAQYTKFEAERNRPIQDLIAQLALAPSTIVDLGCGPGNSTELLASRFPAARLVGVDNSPDMIEAARRRLPDVPFELADLATWTGTCDLLFANAALQWVHDHERLLPALIANLAPHGQLAVQMPDNLNEPAHRLMREVAGSGPWATKLAGAASARAPRHDATWYLRVLQPLVASCDAWRTTYHHVLASPAAIVEWFEGSGLRPFLEPLDEIERAAFLARYTAEVAAAYPALPDGSVVLPFPRLFFVATK